VSKEGKLLTLLLVSVDAFLSVKVKRSLTYCHQQRPAIDVLNLALWGLPFLLFTATKDFLWFPLTTSTTTTWLIV